VEHSGNLPVTKLNDTVHSGAEYTKTQLGNEYIFKDGGISTNV
jgi:hypothetical protein